MRRRRLLQQRRGGAEAQREDGQPAEAEGEGERRRADENVIGRHLQDFSCIAVGYDQQIAVKMHRRFRHAGRAGGEAEQGDIVAAGAHRIEGRRLGERGAIELGVVAGGAVEADDLLQEAAVLGAGDHVVHQARVAQRQRGLRLVDNLGDFTGAQHRHGVDHDRTGLGGRKPAGDHCRVVGGADHDPVSRFHAVVFDQRVRQPVRPRGKFPVGADAAAPDQRGAVAKAIFDLPIRQFDRGVEVFGIVEAVEQKIRPLLPRWKIVARESVDMRGRSKHSAVPRFLLDRGMTMPDPVVLRFVYG